MGVLLVVIPVAIFLAAALSVSRADARLPSNFFTAHRKASVTVFSTSSVAYAFQMSTIYPFLIWGASRFLLIPLMNTVFWGLGIYLFQLSLQWHPQINKNGDSLHGLLGREYGPSVRKVASYLTIIGCLGFAVSELYFGSQVLIAVLDGRWAMYALMFSVSLLVYSYVAYGGQLSSLRTDQLQLAISYLGFFGILSYFLFILRRQPLDNSAYAAVALCALLVPLIIFRRRARFLDITFGGPLGRSCGRLLNALIILLLGGLVVEELLLLANGSSGSSAHHFFDLTGFGIPGLLSLSILPLCFQFVDLTNWQRLLSLNSSGSSVADLRKASRRGLLTYSLESPFTWLVALFFGMLATSVVTKVDPKNLLVDLPLKLLQSTSSVEHVVAYIFILSVISVMLSTVDSFMVGIIYTFTYDSYGPTQRVLDGAEEELSESAARQIIKTGRVFGGVILVVGLASLFIFDRVIPTGGDLFVNLLLSFYSAQLSFFPLVFGTLFLRGRITDKWANVTMLFGASAGIVSGLYAVIWKPEYAWYPILLCFAISCVVYAAGYGRMKKSHRSS